MKNHMGKIKNEYFFLQKIDCLKIANSEEHINFF